MKASMIKKKAQILRVISREDYYSILSFLEEIYLSDYDLKIFKARKMSNVFLALRELMLQEDGGRVRELYKRKFPDPDKEPVIITDWAVDYFDITHSDREIHSVLLIDDIIIHGRTLVNLYSVVKNRYPDAEIVIKTFAKNEDHIKWRVIEEAEYKHRGNLEKCRKYSQIFVDIFMVMTQPYTSYVPNIAVRLDGRKSSKESVERDIAGLKKFIGSEGVVQNLYPDVNIKIPFHKAWAYVSQPNRENVLFASVRIYYNSESDEYAVVPMVSIKPISEETLVAQLSILAQNGIYTEKFAERWRVTSGSVGRLDYRVLVYTLSELWGRQFFQENGLFEAESCNDFEVLEEERMNFGRQLLNRERLSRLSVKEIDYLFGLIEKEYRKVENSVFLDSEDGKVKELRGALAKIIKEFKSEREDTDKDWGDVIRSFLGVDSELDEEAWKEWSAKYGSCEDFMNLPKRISGLPIVLFCEMAEKTELRDVYGEILKTIDHGEGSIVPECVTDREGRRYFLSAIHAGEQNYRYVELIYYPELYGLYHIEERLRGKQQKNGKEGIMPSAGDDAEEIKKQFLKMINAYDNPILQKYEKQSVGNEYESPLDSDHFLYVGEGKLDRIIVTAEKLLGRYVGRETFY